MNPDRKPGATVLVTGGAGYIGSHVVWALHDRGDTVIVLDNLSTGTTQFLPPAVPVVRGDVGDRPLVSSVLNGYKPDAVMHLAAKVVAPESVADPLGYYHNNVCKSRQLLDTCLSAGVTQVLFSSSALVYGDPAMVPLHEEMVGQPINPYGSGKLMVEWMLRDIAAATPLRYAALRYFNVAGADPAGRAGQATPGATHLIKVACEVALGLRPVLQVFGDDYDTPDGTCIRDYIHIADLADAHLKALDHLLTGGDSRVWNCGYGRGSSVRDVIATMDRVLDRPLPVEKAPRRPGDPPRLVADATRIREELGWTPRHDDLDGVVRSALAWERRLHQTAGTAAAP